MKFFEKKQKNAETIVIIGCNPVGAALAGLFSAHGYQTSVVDQSAENFENLPPTYLGNVILGNIEENQVEQDAAIQNADKIFIVTSSDVFNIYIAQILRQKQGEELKIIARINEPERADAYSIFNIETVSVEEMFAEEILRKMRSPVNED